MTFSNKVTWAINPDRCALLIHDMQPHYLKAVPADQRALIMHNARSIGTACMARGIPTFASRVPAQDRRERGLMLDMWGGGPTIENDEIHPALGLDECDVRLLTKRSYSAFYGNDFEIVLRRLGRDSILIVGVYTSIGCYCSAVDAFMRDIRAFVVADATADFNAADHAKGLETAARLCACVVDSEKVIGSLSSRSGRGATRPVGIDVC